MTYWFEAEGSIPIDVDDWWWFAEKFGGGCGNQVGVWRGGKKQLSERRWGVLSQQLRTFCGISCPLHKTFSYPYSRALNLLLPQVFLFSTPSLCPVKIGLTCADIGCTRRRSPKWFKSKIRQC